MEAARLRLVPRSPHDDVLDAIPDARDGFTRLDRAILVIVHELQRELGRSTVPTITVWGRLVERGFHVTQDELNERLARLGAVLARREDD